MYREALYQNSIQVLANYKIPLAKFLRVLLHVLLYSKSLTILASYEAKIAKICNFWTFWPVIQLMYHLFKIRKKP